MASPIIEFVNVSKVFVGTKALDNVSFAIEKGEVHALLGENGAGKSTLLSILQGVLICDGGNIVINGSPINFKTVCDALRFGISMVHQEINMAKELSVGQNITLGYEPSRYGFIDYKELHKQVNDILKNLGCSFRSEDKMHAFSVGELQMIAIAKALFHQASIISFDEPTSALSSKEVDVLFQVIRNLKNKGITIVYVSHRLEEVFEISDRATVLRDGKYIDTFRTGEITKKDLIKSMVGRDVASFATRLKPSCVGDEIVLKVHKLSRAPIFNNISFNVKRGEIVGLAGLVGAKRTDVMRTIFGVDKKTGGEIIYKGNIVQIRSPEEALKIGIGLVPEERKTQGFIKYFNNSENIGLTCMNRFIRFGLVHHGLKTKNCKYYLEQMNVTPPDPHYNTINLSGGNQQKIIIAKWLSSYVDVLILDEPTKGVDVGAKAEIYRLLEELVSKGKSIIIVSSELSEVIGMSDRVIVMKEGKKMKEIDRADLSEELILSYAMGVQK